MASSFYYGEGNPHPSPAPGPSQEWAECQASAGVELSRDRLEAWEGPELAQVRAEDQTFISAARREDSLPISATLEDLGIPIGFLSSSCGRLEECLTTMIRHSRLPSVAAR